MLFNVITLIFDSLSYFGLDKKMLVPVCTGEQREIFLVFNVNTEMFLREGWSTYGLFPAHRYHLELN